MPKLKERRKQIAEMTPGEAQRELKDLREKLFNLRLQQQRGEIKNNRVFTQTQEGHRARAVSFDAVGGRIMTQQAQPTSSRDSSRTDTCREAAPPAESGDGRQQ